MEKTLRVLNKMVKDGVIAQYAIGDAVAAIFYIEPINTNDLDIFFHMKNPSSLDMLTPIYKYLKRAGYVAKGEAVEIEDWPVQFLPVFNPLVDEAVTQAKEVTLGRTKTRVMTAEHLVAIMLQTGRLKDYARIQQFFQHRAVNRRKLASILSSHNLDNEWATFERKHL